MCGAHTAIAPQRKVLFYKGTVFHTSTKENEVLIVAGEDVCDDESAINADMFILDRDNSLHFSWKCTKSGVCLDTYVATNIEVHCPIEAAVNEGITISEDQFEELQTIRQDISELVPQEIDIQEDALTDGDSDSDDGEQIGRCNIPSLTRSSRRVRAPASLLRVWGKEQRTLRSMLSYN
ncbi:uncharacterized protein LOC144648395 [Oculina patagonica]